MDAAAGTRRVPVPTAPAQSGAVGRPLTPPPTDGPAQRRARLLTLILGTLLVLLATATVVILAVNPSGSPRRAEYAAVVLATLVLLAAAFAFNRSGRYLVAAGLTVACAIIAPWSSVALDPTILRGDFMPLTYVVVPVLLAGILLSAGITIAVGASQIAALLLVRLGVPSAHAVNWPSLCIMVAFVSSLSVMGNLVNRRDLEQIERQNRSLEQSEARLREQSVRDHLSGLFNRRYLEETLERELRRAARNGAPVGVIMLDIDGFKKLNDTYGHVVADRVLQRLGSCLREEVRFADIACRYGGDEFTLIMPEAPLQAVLDRAEQVRRTAGAVGGTAEAAPAVTLSLGVAMYPEHGETGAALLAAADAALYRAKHAGRDRVAVAR